MRMSDVWPSGFDGVDFSYGFYESAETLGGEKFKATESNTLCGLLFSNDEPAKAMMHAINNHDRMADEIAELREACVGIYDDFAYEEIISMSPSIFEVWKLGKKFKNK